MGIPEEFKEVHKETLNDVIHWLEYGLSREKQKQKPFVMAKLTHLINTLKGEPKQANYALAHITNSFFAENNGEYTPSTEGVTFGFDLSIWWIGSMHHLDFLYKKHEELLSKQN